LELSVPVSIHFVEPAHQHAALLLCAACRRPWCPCCLCWVHTPGCASQQQAEGQSCDDGPVRTHAAQAG
jgi:hypothetical protein